MENLTLLDKIVVHKQMSIPVRRKKICDIKGLENFIHYEIDVNGNVWSYKRRTPAILKPGWAKKKGSYLIVGLRNTNNKRENFYIHRLVAMAYLPCNDFSSRIRHINNNYSDNRIENLEWIEKKNNIQVISSNEKPMQIIDDSLLNKLKEVHAASHRKGLKVPDSYEFTNKMINDAMDQYINQYGLRKVMGN